MVQITSKLEFSSSYNQCLIADPLLVIDQPRSHRKSCSNQAKSHGSHRWTLLLSDSSTVDARPLDLPILVSKPVTALPWTTSLTMSRSVCVHGEMRAEINGLGACPRDRPPRPGPMPVHAMQANTCGLVCQKPKKDLFFFSF